jgi:FlaA1/EpsC-like NDP-sugar epimerase
MKNRKNRICIIGAGFAGQSIAAEIRSKGIFGQVVLFLDDDPAKIGTRIDGVPVEGPIANVQRILRRHPAEEALIAVPSASREWLRETYGILKKGEFAKIRLLPGLSQIVEGDAHLIQTREISAQDILSRTQVVIPLKRSLAYLRGKRVLITGAGGSIGSELARQLLSGGAERLYLFDHGENSVYEIDKELRLLQEEGVGERATIVPIVGELQDADYVSFILGRLKADVIFHCAAHKHVPMVEANPVEAVKNNVFGTSHMVEGAVKAGTSRFVLISPDKAVEPISVYGVTKMLAEEIVLGRKAPGFSPMVVRFGNVLASTGSIVPLFAKQILKGGPVTVTHEKAQRFFMTIPEASSLVLKAGGVGTAGTIYVLDMGEPIGIKDLAEQMIRFYGFTPETEIPIRYIGLRPGEKIDERLWADDERPVPTEHPRIMRLERSPRWTGTLDRILRELRSICYFDKEKPEAFRNRKLLREILRSCSPSLEVPKNEPQY